ncbi:MAG: sensor domain-containing protein [Anaerolineae bacterium]|nr:sensor domain-containing protein [Anaerolineae bacterium]
MAQKSWLDALTDGQILRDWFSLLVHFVLGMTYFMFVIGGFATAGGLSFILIGIPLLMFMLATTRTIAAMDRQIFGAILDEETPPVIEDLDMRGANLGERLGMLLGSSTTWRSILYILIKLPLGVGAFFASMLILPLLALEVLILGPLTIDMRLISVRLLHWLALAAHRFPGLLLPTTSKRKRDISRLESYREEQAEPEYYIDDDGELALRKRR